MTATWSSTCASEIQAHVTGVRLVSGKNPHVVFVLEVTCGNRAWTALRRYSDFDDLYQELCSTFPARFIDDVRMPSKRLIKMHKFEPAFIASRQQGLDRFVQDLLANSVTSKSIAVRKFFSEDWMAAHGLLPEQANPLVDYEAAKAAKERSSAPPPKDSTAARDELERQQMKQAWLSLQQDQQRVLLTADNFRQLQDEERQQHQQSHSTLQQQPHQQPQSPPQQQQQQQQPQQQQQHHHQQQHSSLQHPQPSTANGGSSMSSPPSPVHRSNSNGSIFNTSRTPPARLTPFYPSQQPPPSQSIFKSLISGWLGESSKRSLLPPRCRIVGSRPVHNRVDVLRSDFDYERAFDGNGTPAKPDAWFRRAAWKKDMPSILEAIYPSRRQVIQRRQFLQDYQRTRFGRSASAPPEPLESLTGNPATPPPSSPLSRSFEENEGLRVRHSYSEASSVETIISPEQQALILLMQQQAERARQEEVLDAVLHEKQLHQQQQQQQQQQQPHHHAQEASPTPTQIADASS
ncbi:hypothetical protein CAOG_004612 [Capsaspora owczarzaki ATCC 30864]|uniref:PX domain-containing protein n=1 Tax=Capsaspora owczarzaki (strain ATCC 30864) TaxID=595528 RepID=A0A0D2X390_CAPO3|nr:hypothetical protein CAOG_004612 [Capsaspora owczarzaki ATCC 30864]